MKHRWSATSTLEEIWEHLRKFASERGGTKCPACGRGVAFAKRRIHRSQAETFLAIARETHRTRSLPHNPRPWVHVERDLVAHGLAPSVGRDWSLLKWWGLIEPASASRDPSAPGSGYWRITEFGIFVFQNPRKSLLSSYVETFANSKRGESSVKVSFASCLGRSFDYADEIRRAV